MESKNVRPSTNSAFCRHFILRFVLMEALCTDRFLCLDHTCQKRFQQTKIKNLHKISKLFHPDNHFCFNLRQTDNEVKISINQQ